MTVRSINFFTVYDAVVCGHGLPGSEILAWRRNAAELPGLQITSSDYVIVEGRPLAAYRKDFMFSRMSRSIPKSLWGQTALMLIILASVLAGLPSFPSRHYFTGAVTVCYGFVIGWLAGWSAEGVTGGSVAM